MGKLICDSTTSSPVIPWRDPTATATAPAPSLKTTAAAAVDLADQLISSVTTWENVLGLEDQQKRHLQRLHAKGILWKHPGNKNPNQDDELNSTAVVFHLSHGGDVEADGNCLFTASKKAMELTEMDSKDLRRRTVGRFLEDHFGGSESERKGIDAAIGHMYSPDLRNGWGIHVVQEAKLLAKKVDRVGLDSAIDELVQLGMQRYIS